MFNRNKVVISTALLSLYSLCASVNVQSQDTFSYSLSIEEEAFGRIIIKHNNQTDGRYIIEQQSHITASGLWEDFNHQGTLKETHTSSGVLVQSGNTVKENDKTFWTKIELLGNEYMAFKSQIKNGQEQEDDESLDLAQGVVAHLVPAAGNILMISEFLLSDEEEEQINKRFTKYSFDSSFLDLPHLWKKNSFSLPSSLRIFDTEEMFIFSATIKAKGKEEIESDGMVIRAHHYTLDVEGDAPTEIWLALGHDDIPYFVQITGEDDGDTYKIAYIPNN
jgi:hypothetical protein